MSLIFAHRGGDDGRPNSIDAVRSVAQRGVDGVEIDIQLRDDGQLIARHDLGESNDSFDTLADMLAAVDELGIRLLIDFKSAGPEAVEREAVALHQALGAVETLADGQVAVSSFSVQFLEQLAERCPELDLYPIISLRQNFVGLGPVARWSGISVLAAAAVVNPWLMARTRRAGGQLIFWFGATEWRPVLWASRKVGAHALIVHNTSN